MCMLTTTQFEDAVGAIARSLECGLHDSDLVVRGAGKYEFQEEKLDA